MRYTALLTSRDRWDRAAYDEETAEVRSADDVPTLTAWAGQLAEPGDVLSIYDGDRLVRLLVYQDGITDLSSRLIGVV